MPDKRTPIDGLVQIFREENLLKELRKTMHVADEKKTNSPINSMLCLLLVLVVIQQKWSQKVLPSKSSTIKMLLVLHSVNSAKIYDLNNSLVNSFLIRDCIIKRLLCYKDVESTLKNSNKNAKDAYKKPVLGVFQKIKEKIFLVLLMLF